MSWKPSPIIIVQLGIYAVVVIAYFLLVLRFLGDFLTWLFINDLPAYSIMALVLIVIQGVALEFLTSILLRFVQLTKFRRS